MKLILVIGGILAISVVGLANGEKHEGTVEVPDESDQQFIQEEDSNRNPEGPHNGHHRYPHGGREPRHHVDPKPKPQSQTQQEPDLAENGIPKIQPVLLDQNQFSILNNAGNGNSYIKGTRTSTTTSTTTELTPSN